MPDVIAVDPIIEAEPAGKRRCAARRQPQPRSGMVRFVVGPDGEVVADVDERLPGRGIWLTAARAVIDAAADRHVFARTVKAAAKVPPGLSDRVESLLLRRCLDVIGLARRAGQLIIGFDQVLEALRQPETAMALIASDAASGQDRLRRLAGDRLVIDVFTRDELGRAVGRTDIVYAAMAAGSLAQKLRREAARLEGLRRVEIDGPLKRGRDATEGVEGR